MCTYACVLRVLSWVTARVESESVRSPGSRTSIHQETRNHTGGCCGVFIFSTGAFSSFILACNCSVSVNSGQTSGPVGTTFTAAAIATPAPKTREATAGSMEADRD